MLTRLNWYFRFWKEKCRKGKTLVNNINNNNNNNNKINNNNNSNNNNNRINFTIKNREHKNS